MLFLKSTAQGRLSELWIDTIKTRKIDMLMRESQFLQTSQHAINLLLNSKTLQELQYYYDGVNAYIETNSLPFDRSWQVDQSIDDLLAGKVSLLAVEVGSIDNEL